MSYGYGGLKRLTDANHYAGAALTPSLTDTERSIAYDRNGNITTLKRYGSTGLENDLSFTHTGNRMTALSDANATGASAGTKSFSYDANGNMISDGRKDFDLSWNLLNLVSGAVMHGSDNYTEDSSLTYAWLSDGTKVSAVADDGNENGVQKRYLGSFVYTSTGGNSAEPPMEVESVAWDEGRIFFNFPEVVDSMGVVDIPVGEEAVIDSLIVVDTAVVAGWFRDCWFAADHLGNVRAVIDINPDLVLPEILEQNDYLPFGTRIQNPTFATATDNRWRYAGKEEQRFGSTASSSLNLSLLDFGARMYDPFTARWTAVDPMAIDYPSISTASYCMGDPLLFRDPDGNDLVLFGTEGSCLTFETDLIDLTYNLNVNWGGTYTFKGNEALSAALDLVGVFDQSGISDAVNAGLQWSDGRRFDAIMSGLSVVPAVGDLAKLTRIKKNSEILGVAYDAIANAGRLKYLRRKAVKEAWEKEREMVIREGKGTIEWTEREINELIETGRVKGYVGHHINNVKHHPEMAGMQENVTFVRSGKEHLNAHGGNYRNETHGPLVSR